MSKLDELIEVAQNVSKISKGIDLQQQEIAKLRAENIELRQQLEGTKYEGEMREKSLTWCLEVEIPRLRAILKNAKQVIQCNRGGVTIDITEHTLRQIIEALETG